MSARLGRVCGRRTVSPLLPVVLGVWLAVSGCASIPTDGPVVTTAMHLGSTDSGALGYEPPAPAEDASPHEVVVGFLEAMKAIPGNYSSAKAFLTPHAAQEWRPEEAVISYRGLVDSTDEVDGAATEDPLTDDARSEAPTSEDAIGAVTRVEREYVAVTLRETQRYDAAGVWDAEAAEKSQRIRLIVARVSGQWRIESVPDALIVPEWWLSTARLEAVAHDLNVGRSRVMPRPVHVLTGDLMFPMLVRAVLAGPPEAQRAMRRTDLPAGLSVDIERTEVSQGVGTITLRGGPELSSWQVSRLAVAQLAWTLRQVPGLHHFKITVDGRPLLMPDGRATASVRGSVQFAPLGPEAQSRTFALVDGRLAQGPPDRLTQVTGPFGTDDLGVREMSVAFDGSSAVGVTADRTALRESVVALDPVAVAAGEAAPARVRTILRGRTHLLAPSRDAAGRLWVVDRTENGAVVLVRSGRNWNEVAVSGITGEDVTRARVTPEGDAFAAVIGDAVWLTRLDSAEAAPLMVARAGESESVVDLGWNAARRLQVLMRQGSSTLEVVQAEMDGSPHLQRSGPLPFRASGQVGLVASPLVGTKVQVYASGLAVEAFTARRQQLILPESLTWLGHAG